MSSRTVLIGYSVRGRAVVAALRANGHANGFTVADSDPVRAEQAVLEGVPAVVGPCWRLRTLWLAGAHTADHVVVAVPDDETAVRITSAVRSLNETATIITVVRSSEVRELVEHAGADHVVDIRQVYEWAPGAVPPQDGGGESPDLEWTLTERAVTQDEVGRSPLVCGHQVLAVMRHGQRIWVEDSKVGVLRDDDRLLVVSSRSVTT
ncbi:NAD-binding protein [Lentzea sp. NBC_00516]|uniref:NAD(P)-binding protein n=1 Tax=Lentzea sp. NBC_00516 TaxID=2903582 RepID=UPI002E80F65E|nr:NAD(P)-binding protein [Lentzea sp. NBC_00516]WUD27319.1 NAD-binding protein [Lentzea sp. NBC_00516]